MLRIYNGMTGISDLARQVFENDGLIIYFKTHVLLYADHTVIFADSNDELQVDLNGLFLYCTSWNLTVN